MKLILPILCLIILSSTVFPISNAQEEPFTLLWRYRTNAPTQIGPLAVDVTGDGVMEIFTVGYNVDEGHGGIFCLNGATGELIWKRTEGLTKSTNIPFEIADLNNDGTYQIVVATTPTIALTAHDGSVFWTSSAKSSRRHLVIADIDGTGYPYVFVGHGGVNDKGTLSKLWGTNGTVQKQVTINYICHGGLSLADMDGNGNYQLFVTDRPSWMNEGYGRGIQCYDAHTLELLWYDGDVTCSSHCAALIDVNKDGILDVVVMHQGYGENGGICIYSGETGERMPGKWERNLGFETHSQFSIADITGDGNLEISIGHGPAKIWCVENWDVKADLGYNVWKPPVFMNVMGDEKLEIVFESNRVIHIFSGQTFEELYSFPTQSSIRKHAFTQDITGDGKNELVLDGKGYVEVWTTPSYAPTPRVRTDSLYFSERNTGAGVYIPPPSHPLEPPLIDIEVSSGIIIASMGLVFVALYVLRKTVLKT